jgi:hypothetical protein
MLSAIGSLLFAEDAQAIAAAYLLESQYLVFA